MSGLNRGFTLVELLVAMGILAMLFLLGLPAMNTYLQNSKLATATSGMYTALQTARTEAIRSNAPAQFVLTDTPVETPNLANALVPAVAGANWVVRATNGAVFRTVEAKAAMEGEASVVAPSIVIAGAASAPAVFDGTIPFNGFGATTTGAPYSIDVSNPNAGICITAGGTIRCRRIVVSPGGQIRACDPAAGVGDNRACN